MADYPTNGMHVYKGIGPVSMQLSARYTINVLPPFGDGTRQPITVDLAASKFGFKRLPSLT